MSDSYELPPSRNPYTARFLQGGPASVTLEFTAAREASPESRYRYACRAASSDLSRLAAEYLAHPSVLAALGLESLPKGATFADISDLVSGLSVDTMILLPIDVYEGILRLRQAVASHMTMHHAENALTMTPLNALATRD